MNASRSVIPFVSSSVSSNEVLRPSLAGMIGQRDEKETMRSRSIHTIVTLNGVAVLAGGSMNLTVGNTYTIKLYSDTVTNTEKGQDCTKIL